MTEAEGPDVNYRVSAHVKGALTTNLGYLDGLLRPHVTLLNVINVVRHCTTCGDARQAFAFLSRGCRARENSFSTTKPSHTTTFRKICHSFLKHHLYHNIRSQYCIQPLNCFLQQSESYPSNHCQATYPISPTNVSPLQIFPDQAMTGPTKPTNDWIGGFPSKYTTFRR